MKEKTKEVLEYLGNNHTKVVQDKEFKGNYYSYMTDTIYLSTNFEDKRNEKEAFGTSKEAGLLVMICHECVHSVQNKYMHIFNTVLSNLSILLTLIVIALRCFNRTSIIFNIISAILIISSIVVRFVLENGAVTGSIKTLQALVDNGIINSVTKEEVEASKKYIQKNKIKALLFMVKDKIIMLLTVIAAVFV